MARRPSAAVVAPKVHRSGEMILDAGQGAKEPSLWEEARKTAAGSPAKGGTACREASAVKSRSYPTPSEQQRCYPLKAIATLARGF